MHAWNPFLSICNCQIERYDVKCLVEENCVIFEAWSHLMKVRDNCFEHPNKVWAGMVEGQVSQWNAFFASTVVIFVMSSCRLIWLAIWFQQKVIVEWKYCYFPAVVLWGCQRSDKLDATLYIKEINGRKRRSVHHNILIAVLDVWIQQELLLSNILLITEFWL